MKEWAKKIYKTASIVAVIVFILVILMGLIIAYGRITEQGVLASIIFSLAIWVIIFAVGCVIQAVKKKK